MQHNHSPYVIVGIGGVTNGGKTTLCNHLKQAFPHAQAIHMDDYFVEPGSEKVRLKLVDSEYFENWDELDAIECDKMMKDAETWICQHSTPTASERKPLLLVEGFLIYNLKQLSPYFSLKFFLHIDKDTCAHRRSARIYNPPDPPNYFEKMAWPQYLKCRKAISDQQDICYIDGAESELQIFEQVQKKITDVVHVNTSRIQLFDDAVNLSV